MLYLLGVMWLATRYGSAAGITGAVLGVAAFDFTVVPPYYSFAVSDTQYIFTFAVMLLAGLFISTITTRLREQESIARNRHSSIAALMEMTRAITGAADMEDLARAVVSQAQNYFQVQCAVIIRENEKPRVVYQSAGLDMDDKELGVAAWVIANGRPAGALTDTLPASRVLAMPFRGVRGTVGALALTRPEMETLIEPPTIDSLRALCEQTAVAIERLLFSAESRRAWADAQRESIRNTLLASVSHDLRTPLAAIAAAAGSLVESGSTGSMERVADAARAITSEADRMDRLIDKLLNMTRLESGRMDLRQEILPVEELIASSIERVSRHEPGVRIRVLPVADIPPCRGDPELLEQVMVNLIENAAEHGNSEAAEPIEVSATGDGEFVRVTVRDHGAGLEADEIPHLFEKFYRSLRNRRHQGLGLGLAICRTIVLLHGGSITGRNHPDGGAEFSIRLPAATTDTGSGKRAEWETS
jgi:two-component system sensor histidine kinase KdpD